MAYQLDDEEEKSVFKAFVGIDFGTDGSGLAYGLPDGSAYIHNMWDDTSATRKPKTSVLFDSSNSVLRVGSEAQSMYLKCTGDQGWKLFERFKMNLYEEPSSKSKLKTMESKMEFVELKEKISTTNNKAVTEDASKVFVAELGYLKKQAFNFIETHLRQKLGLKGDKQNGWPEIQYCLTVPAIWSDKAKDQMVQWAIQAGLITGKIDNQLRIVYEPDCASLSIQHAILRNMKGIKPPVENPESTQNISDIKEWLKSNNLQQLIPKFTSENLTMTELIEIGEQPDELKEFLKALNIKTASVIRICSKIKKILADKGKKKKNDKTKLNPLQPQINIDVKLNVGDKYILCDIGGGTCDVACHEVMGDFSIAEVLHPSGGKWGATYIDERFIQLLGELFTKDLLNIFQMAEESGRTSYLTFLSHFLNDAKISFYENIGKTKNPNYHDIAMPARFVNFVATQYNKEFNEGEDSLDVKRILLQLNKKLSDIGKKYKRHKAAPAAYSSGLSNPTDDVEGDECENEEDDKPKRDWMIKIIRAEDDDIEEEYVLSMHINIWEMLFDKIIKPITAHCQKILRKNEMKLTKYIFMVGGFANSKYFQMKMKKAFSSYKNLKVTLPGLPGLCVVDGAARYALDKKFIKVRRLAKTYGISTSSKRSDVDEKKFPRNYIKNNLQTINNETWVRGIFTSFVKKNQAIQIASKPISRTFNKADKNAKSVGIKIFSSNESNPLVADKNNQLGKVSVPMKTTDQKVVVEFSFSSNLLTVYAHPKGKAQLKKKCQVEYY